MTKKNNTTPKGYKPSPLGSIPNDWEFDTWGNLCDKILDGTHFSPKSKEGPFMYITSKNIRNEGLDLTNISYVSEKEHTDIYKRCPVKFGDILLTKDGAGTGAVCKNILKQEFSLLSSVAVIRSKSKVLDNDYLFQFIKSPKGQKVIQDAISGQAITRITLEKIRSFKLVFPTPLKEQTAIANLLSTWDNAINTLTQLIAQKELRKKWLMQQLLTGKKRLKGFKGEWKRHHYHELLEEVKRPVDWNDNELYHLISVRRRSGGIFERESLYGHQIKVKDLRTARKGDFLFSKMQIVHGASALVTKDFNGTKISGSYIAVNASDKKKLDIEFFDWYSKTPYFYHQTYISSYGVHIEKMTFDFENFLTLDMKLPAIEEQQAIVKVLQSSTDEITLLGRRLNFLKDQKKGLMQILLTGKKRLKVK